MADTTDCSTFLSGTSTPDLDPSFTLIAGRQCTAERFARRLMTPREGLVGDRDFGFDVRTYVHCKMTSSKRAELQNGVRKEGKKDEYILEVDVSDVAQNPDGTLDLDLEVTDADGPFELTLHVSELTVEILNGPNEL
jgi:hypothetical protein